MANISGFAFNGCRQCFSGGPPIGIQALSDCCSPNAGPLGPLGKAQCLSIVCQYAIVAVVARLFLWCCPTAIPGFVITIIVNTINRVARIWHRSDVFQECCKRRSPSFAHSDTATAPVIIIGHRWPITPLFNSLPYVVLRRLVSSVGSMICKTHLLLQATTTACLSSCQFASRYKHGFSTFAAALPKYSALPVFAAMLVHRKHCESVEGFPRVVDKSSHCLFSLMLS